MVGFNFVLLGTLEQKYASHMQGSLENREFK